MQSYFLIFPESVRLDSTDSSFGRVMFRSSPFSASWISSPLRSVCLVSPLGRPTVVSSDMLRLFSVSYLKKSSIAAVSDLFKYPQSRIYSADRSDARSTLKDINEKPPPP